ncbi:protein FAM83C-like [Gouania willdenowi]|uniref:protein FAM83C-like n=1 Tax=Gouania willdenowi TaxID=441366 RepID=UPI0010542400|nr:protein FAM83C-like [Gouania willdenowi]
MMSSENLRPANNGRKPLGKLASRLEEVKNPWRTGSTLVLSHNEAARLATDALLELGEPEYRRVLDQERELSFLSPLEIHYIGQHVAKEAAGSDVPGAAAERDFGDGDAVSELTSGTYFPMMSDEEPPMLELGWPESPSRYGPSETQIYFQRDKSHNIKDLVRSLVSEAKKVIAVVMDVFTDIDLFCDLMEASNKRRVPVYVLLDDKNLQYFTDMCSTLDINNSHLSNMRIRSVCGDTYCTKSGKKFTGQVLEKFLIVDCEQVLAGSYSFTWLSAQVHSNMVMHFSGRVVDSFDREFRCLYADSQVIDGFFNPDDEGMAFYPPYPPMMAAGLDLLAERQRERVGSENSSSQSSNSVSSVKVAPGMTSNNHYKVNEGHDKMENAVSSHLTPEQRGGGSGDRTRVQTPTAGGRGLANGASNHGPGTDRPLPNYGMSMGIEWNKPSPLDSIRSDVFRSDPLRSENLRSENFRSENFRSDPLRSEHFWSDPVRSDGLRTNHGGVSSKFQALGLYDHKPNMFHSSGLGTNTQNQNLKSSALTPVGDGKPTPKPRTPPTPLFTKLSDMFLPTSSKDKDQQGFRRTPSPLGQTAWGGPDLSQPEPESEQSPPPPSPVSFMNRQDQKRMTLGHSKLDLVNQYNQMKSKQVYSRFELKSSN